MDHRARVIALSALSILWLTKSPGRWVSAFTPSIVLPYLSASRLSISYVHPKCGYSQGRLLHMMSSPSESTVSSPCPDDGGQIEAAGMPQRRSSRRKTSVAASSTRGDIKLSAKVGKESKYFSTKGQTSDPTIPEDAANNNLEMLEEWIQHSHFQYHIDNFLSPPQAYKIRTALVKWYRANRRKLPWRGDLEPYDGSTAGYGGGGSASVAKGKASDGNKKRKTSAIKSNSGKDIRSFFSASSKKKKSKLTDPGLGCEGEEKKEDEDTKQALDLGGDVTLSTTDKAKREVTAYGVWVSEIMLQQTRVEAVIPYYLKWMESFPTVHDLANATDEEVNSHWAGLGFYRRARLLHAGAKRVVNDYDGVVPNTVEGLMKVEGIGRYTASAVASIAYGVEVPVVDGNVCRVLSRLTGVANHIKSGVLKDDLGWTLAERIVQTKFCIDDDTTNVNIDDLGSPGEVNQALMELGATYCSPAGSGLEVGDPLREFYASTRIGTGIGRAVCFGDDSSKRRVENLIATSGNSGCRLCDPNGVSSVFYDITDRIAADLTSTEANPKPENIAAKAGHAAIPTPPPKKAKREEVLAVAVVTLKSKEEEDRWLMVKRPPEGLLAGQWEFPSVCVWNSAEEKSQTSKKKKDATENKPKKQNDIEIPTIDSKVRSMALDSYLSKLLGIKTSVKGRKKVGDSPIEHVFSHVRHTMYVEHANISNNRCSNIAMRWTTEDNVDVGFLTEGDMQAVGITSGVRKVLASVQKSKN